MFKTTKKEDEDFEKPQPTKKKPKKKCSERQLENLRRARAIAKKNREAKKQNKSEPVKVVEKNIDQNVTKTIETPKREDIRIERKPRQKKVFTKRNVIQQNNPFNIDFTEIMKHQMTLQHQKVLYVNQQKRREYLQRQQRNKRTVNRQKKKPINSIETSKDVKPKKVNPPPTPFNNLYKNNSYFFSGLFDA